MKNNLKIASLFILIVACIFLIIKNILYKNILLLILPFLSFYLGKIYGREKRNKKKEIQPQTSQPHIPNIPKEFKDEQEKFKQLNEPRGLEK